MKHTLILFILFFFTISITTFISYTESNASNEESISCTRVELITVPSRGGAQIQVWTDNYVYDLIFADESGSGILNVANGLCSTVHYVIVNDIDCSQPTCIYYFYPVNSAFSYVDSDCGCDEDNKLKSNNQINSILLQNYPNPFNPSTDISFYLTEPMNVKLTIYNSIGEEVSILVNDFLRPGSHKFSFNGSDLTSGIYFYKIETENFTDIKKMVLLK